jgi:hypothetical protein
VVATQLAGATLSNVAWSTAETLEEPRNGIRNKSELGSDLVAYPGQKASGSAPHEGWKRRIVYTKRRTESNLFEICARSTPRPDGLGNVSYRE